MNGVEREQVTKTDQMDYQEDSAASAQAVLPPPAPVHPLLWLQQTIGNMAVQRLARLGAFQPQPGTTGTAAFASSLVGYGPGAVGQALLMAAVQQTLSQGRPSGTARPTSATSLPVALPLATPIMTPGTMTARPAPYPGPPATPAPPAAPVTAPAPSAPEAMRLTLGLLAPLPRVAAPALPAPEMRRAPAPPEAVVAPAVPPKTAGQAVPAPTPALTPTEAIAPVPTTATRAAPAPAAPAPPPVVMARTAPAAPPPGPLPAVVVAPPPPGAPAAAGTPTPSLPKPETVAPAPPVATATVAPAAATPAAPSGPPAAAAPAAVTAASTRPEAATPTSPAALGEAGPAGATTEAAPPAAAGTAGAKAPASATEDPAFQQVIAHTRAVAARLGHNTPAQTKAAQAQAAAVSPPSEMASQASAGQVQEMAQQQPKPFDRVAFKAALMQKIASITPKNLEEADQFKKSGKVGTVKGALTTTVSTGKEQAQGAIAAKTQETPDASGIQPKPVTPLPPADPGPPPPDVGAAAAAPKPKTEAEVSLQEGSNQLDQKMADADVTEEQLQKSNEPTFQGAVDAKKTAQADAAQAPQAYRQDEQGTLAQAQVGAATTAQTQLQGMHGGREQFLTRIEGVQVNTKGEDEQERAQVASHIQAIYEKTKQSVEDRLKHLDDEVNQAFDQGAASAQKAFEDYVEQRMDAYKFNRYISTPGGLLLWAKDKLLGLPDEVNVFYEEGRNLYIAQMDAVLDNIATLVETGLTEAKALITQGKQEIQEYVSGLSPALQEVGQKAAQDIQGKFDALEQSTNDKQNQLIDSLAQKYVENLQKLDDRIKEMKASNRGLVDAALDAINGVIDTIINLKNMLLNVLARAANAIDLVIKDPIGFLGNLVAGVKLGFNNFIGKIGHYLQQGLLQWLFGALAEAGIQMPDNFDLKGILSLVLQVLGLTYANIRARAVAIVGEKIVSALEQAAEIFKILITEGPAGLWEYIKEKIGDLKSMVIDQIKSFVMERIIIAGVTWIIGLLNPASAFVKACKAIYDIIMFFVERGSQILALVNAVIDSVTSIAQGAIGVAANFVENALGKAIPVVIGFLAALLGLGGISEKIKSVIDTIRKPINAAIDWVIKKAVDLVKAAGKLLGFGKKEEAPETQDPEKDLKVQAGLAAIDEEDQRYAKTGKMSREDAEKVAADVKAKHPVFKSIIVVDGQDTWDYDYVASPGKRYKGVHKGGGLLKVASVKVKPELAEKVETARAAGGRDWELAVEAAVVKEVLVPKWEIVLQVPIQIVVRGEKEFAYPSREDLARLKVQRGHRYAKDPTRYPDISMEVKEPAGGGALKEVRVVEITLVEDFTAQGDFERHKVDQFTYTLQIFKNKYGDQVPIIYHFLTPREPTPDTKDFIVGTLLSQGMKNVKVVWLVVKTK